MKKKVLVFVGVALLALTVVPAINLKLGTQKKGYEWWSKLVLYNLDFVLPYQSRFFYSLGISIEPKQVIIGKNDWLYLGDQYEKTITTMRRGATSNDVDTAKKIGFATKAWEQWLALKGVHLFQVMLGPNKGTIYPEFLPDWAQPAADSVTNVLLANVSHGLYVDTRLALWAAKSQFQEPLYYQTDTHWNSLGAWVAFRALGMSVTKTQKELRWLSDRQVRVSKVNDHYGGADLANFLRMAKTLRDIEVTVEIASDTPIEIEQYDFDTGHLAVSGGNPKILAPQSPLLVKSKHALNKKRVLWLRDSFGTALTPYMAATFTETLQVHYGITDPVKFAQLVETYKPDYVFITVVERDTRDKWFENLPPKKAATWTRKNFISLSQGTQYKINDMTKSEGAETYRISGVDPYVTFTLSKPIRMKDATHLIFDLNCVEKKGSVSVQVFWQTTGNIFTEANSVHITASTGITAVNLSSFSSWNQEGEVTDLRIDFDSPSTCPSLIIKGVELGKLETGSD